MARTCTGFPLAPDVSTRTRARRATRALRGVTGGTDLGTSTRWGVESGGWTLGGWEVSWRQLYLEVPWSHCERCGSSTRREEGGKRGEEV